MVTACTASNVKYPGNPTTSNGVDTIAAEKMTAGTMLTTTMEPPAKIASAAAFAVKMVDGSRGSGPRIDASRTSSASAFHSTSVNSAITAIDHPI